METKVGAAGGALEPDVIEDHKLRHRGVVDGVLAADLARAGMVTQTGPLSISCR